MKSKFVISAALLLGSLTFTDAAVAGKHKNCAGLTGDEAAACLCDGKSGASLESCTTRVKETQKGSAKTQSEATGHTAGSHASQAAAQIQGGDVSAKRKNFGG